MERQRFLPLLAVIIFIWALWRYEAALALLGFFCNLIMPFIIGGCLAFIVNVPLVHIERLWQKLFARFSSDWPQKIKRPVCLIFTLTLIIGIVLIGGLKIGPDLHQSFNMIVKTLPKASAELTVSLKERWSELALSPDTLDSIGYLCGFTFGWGAIGIWCGFPISLTTLGLLLWRRFNRLTIKK